MNAKKFPYEQRFFQFLPVKALVCVYTDLASLKSPSLQLNKILAKLHLQFFVFVTFIMGIVH